MSLADGEQFGDPGSQGYIIGVLKAACVHARCTASLAAYGIATESAMHSTAQHRLPFQALLIRSCYHLQCSAVAKMTASTSSSCCDSRTCQSLPW